jgi:lipoprotein-anchoring transpeptidase ErfK/SrfK
MAPPGTTLRETSTFAVLALLAVGCRRAAPGTGSDAGKADGANATAPAPPPPPDGPRLAAIAMQVNVYSRPDNASKRFGYLRLGAVVARDPAPVSTNGCPGGWYRIYPNGFVCAGDEAALDANHDIVRAAAVRPDLSKPLPYKYAFVRAVAPLYLKVPSAKEQFAAEFKLQEHLDWWKQEGDEASKVVYGANDVPIDSLGAPLPPKPKDAGAPAQTERLSTERSLGELLGGQGPSDPVPFWLEGGRKIPNLADFKVPAYAYFANRTRRHTGLALVGSFSTGADSLERRFAVTVDMRLVPASKIKPDTGSAFHGTELGDGWTLPLAFVRSECRPAKQKPCAHAWSLTGDGAHEEDRTLRWRSLVRLSGKTKRVGPSLYRETNDGVWLKASDLGVINEPAEWPASAQAGQKWVDISIENQTLILWEGQRPVYATLISSGQDGTGDPKTTKSTIMGSFRIRSKHVTATMDSNERSSQGGGPAPSAEGTKDDRDPATPEAKPKLAGSAESGPQRRRGEGTFELRDVPYVAYFESGYALHAAYWHDVFGKPRSHGCVNLSPVDAHKLFLWSEPRVPDGWHGVFTGADWAEGTAVIVHK